MPLPLGNPFLEFPPLPQLHLPRMDDNLLVCVLMATYTLLLVICVYTYVYVYVCGCVHVYVCVCMYMRIERDIDIDVEHLLCARHSSWHFKPISEKVAKPSRNLHSSRAERP